MDHPALQRELKLFPISEICLRRIHPVFYVSALKLKLVTLDKIETNLPTRVDQFEWELEIILDQGMFKQQNNVVTRWSIKWKDYSVEEATWEDAIDFISRFTTL